MQRIDQLLVVDAVGFGRGLVDHLANAVGLGRIGADVAGGATVLGDEFADEFVVVCRLCAGPPAGGDEDALGIGGANLVREVLALIRAGGFNDRFRVVVLPLERLDEGDTIRFLGAKDHDIGLGVDDLLCQRVPGRRLRGVHLVGRGRDATGFERQGREPVRRWIAPKPDGDDP